MYIFHTEVLTGILSKNHTHTRTRTHTHTHTHQTKNHMLISITLNIT